MKGSIKSVITNEKQIPDLKDVYLQANELLKSGNYKEKRGTKDIVRKTAQAVAILLKKFGRDYKNLENPLFELVDLLIKSGDFYYKGLGFKVQSVLFANDLDDSNLSYGSTIFNNFLKSKQDDIIQIWLSEIKGIFEQRNVSFVHFESFIAPKLYDIFIDLFEKQSKDNINLFFQDNDLQGLTLDDIYHIFYKLKAVITHIFIEEFGSNPQVFYFLNRIDHLLYLIGSYLLDNLYEKYEMIFKERYKIEKQLMYLKHALDNSLVVLEFSVSGMVIDTNKKAESVTGYKRHEIRGKNFISLAKMLGISDFDKINEILESGKAGNTTLKGKNRSGDDFWIDINITPITNNGKVDKFLVLINDITAQKQAYEQLKNFSFTDALTNVGNRRAFDEYLNQKIYEFNRGIIQKLSLIMFDIDHFKSINDKYGHDVGDFVLKEVATVVSKLLRQSDRVFRYGGEEFAIVCLCDLNGAIELAERIRKIIENHAFNYNGKTIKLTASFGISELEKGDSDPLFTLVKGADRKLYEAKRTGRNRVVA